MKKGFRNRVCSISMAVAMAMLTACGAAEKPAEGLVPPGTETGTTESGQAETGVTESSQTENGITESSQTDDGATESSQADTSVTESTLENTDATKAQPEYVTKLHITINPDMALYLDEADSVVLVEYLNEDAEKAYAGTDMTGITINEAMDVIVDTAFAGGYLTEGKTISVDVVECAEERTEELTTQLQTLVQEAVAEKELAGTVTVRVRSPVNCAEEHTESLVRSATERALCPTTASCATAERNVPSAAEQEWRSKHVNKLQKGDTTVMRYLLFYISDLLKNYCPAAAAAAACSFRTLISHCWLLIIDS